MDEDAKMEILLAAPKETRDMNDSKIKQLVGYN